MSSITTLFTGLLCKLMMCSTCKTSYIIVYAMKKYVQYVYIFSMHGHLCIVIISRRASERVSNIIMHTLHQNVT